MSADPQAPAVGSPPATARSAAATLGNLALYVHVPFCARRCTYCDFDFEIGGRPRTQAFVAGLAREVSRRAPELAGRVRTIYFGGGTPSLVGVGGLEAIAQVLAPWIDGDPLDEFTVELNPEHVDEALLAALRRIGVDRVSLGVQSFEAPALRQLGRAHDPKRAHEAVAACLAAGFRTSVDLIVGWPGQDTAALDRDLDRVLGLGVAHLSVYALTIEPGTSWPKLVRRGLRVLPDDDAQAGALEQTHARLVGEGLEHYEVASYARVGERAQHNGVYWSWRDYVGIGPSAASAAYDGRGGVVRRTNPRGLDAWLTDAPPEIEQLDPTAAAAEGLWLALRTADGVEIDAFLRRFAAVDEAWLRARVDRRVRSGDLQWHQRRLCTAPGRWMVLDAIATDVLA